MYDFFLSLGTSADIVVGLDDVKSIDGGADGGADVDIEDEDDEVPGIKLVMLLDFVMLDLRVRFFLGGIVKPCQDVGDYLMGMISPLLFLNFLSKVHYKILLVYVETKEAYSRGKHMKPVIPVFLLAARSLASPNLILHQIFKHLASNRRFDLTNARPYVV